MPALKAKDIMSKRVVTVAPTDTVKQLNALLAKKKISGAPVLDADNNMVGIVTEADVLTARANTKVQSVMKSPVITVGPNEPVKKVAQLLTKKRIKRVPVVDQKTGKLLGIISRADIVKAIAG